MPARDPYKWHSKIEELADEARDDAAFELARALEALAAVVLTGREERAANLLEHAPARA